MQTNWPNHFITNLIAHTHRTAVTTNPIHDAEMGIENGPTTKAQSFNARARCMIATRPKMAADIPRYAWVVFSSMFEVPFVNAGC